MNPWLYYTLALTFVAVGVVCWLSNLVSLPGNWALVGCSALFVWLMPHSESRGATWTTVWILIGLAVLGEIIEFAAGSVSAAKQGASRRAIWMSLVGAMVGSIGGAVAGAPIPIFGSLAGALLGGSAGAFAGAYLGELQGESTHGRGLAVGKAAFMGRLWGTVGKFAVGAVMLGVMTVDVMLA